MSTPFLNQPSSVLSMGCALAVLVLTTGCSLPSHVKTQRIRSTEALPKSVRVADAYSDRTYWKKTIPPGATLAIDWTYPEAEGSEAMRARLKQWAWLDTEPDALPSPVSMRWTMVKAGQTIGHGNIDLAGLTTELLVSAYRPERAAFGSEAGKPGQKAKQNAGQGADPAPLTTPKAGSQTESKNPNPSPDDDIVITVAPDGRYFLGKESVDLPDLKATLQGLATTSPGTQIAVRSLGQTSQKHVKALLDALATLDLKVRRVQTPSKASSPK